MGLVFNNNSRSNFSDKQYISYPKCRATVSQQRQVRVLTHQNIRFLKSLNLKVAPGGKSRV